MHLPDHIYQASRFTEEAASAQAEIWVEHVKGCPHCLRRLLGIDRIDAVDQYFKTNVMRPEDASTLRELKQNLQAGDELYDTLVEVLVWYYLIARAPQ